LPYRPVSDKGVLRAWLAERVLAAHASGRVRVVIGRAPELYGPKVESLLAGNVFAAALAGRRALWIGALDQPLAPMFIGDFAHGLAELGEHEDAVGGIWHIPTPAPITARRFIEIAFDAAGRRTRIVQLGQTPVRALGLVWPIAREGAEMLYQFRQPHSVDAGKFRATIGAGQVTPYDQGIKSTLDWYRGRPRTSVLGFGR
jgi:nucleoside-diphosphate-sugar epimerase